MIQAMNLLIKNSETLLTQSLSNKGKNKRYRKIVETQSTREGEKEEREIM